MDLLNDTPFSSVNIEFDSSRLASFFDQQRIESDDFGFVQSFVSNFDLSDGANDADIDLFSSRVTARTSISDIEAVLQLQPCDATAEWRDLPSFNRNFSSALSFGEPPAKAVRRSPSYKLKTEGLSSLPSLPSLASSFSLNSSFQQQPDHSLVKAESLIPASSSKIAFQIGGFDEEVSSKADQQFPQSLLVEHDQDLLNTIMNTGKLAPKPSVAVPKRVDSFKCRETAKQRQQRYNDIEKTNKMLTQSLKEARETVDAALEVLVALWADGMCDLDLCQTPKCSP